MRYAGIIKNDFSAAPGVCVSFFVQGCPIHCEGCHNKEAWDFNGGHEFTIDTLQSIKDAITANGIFRSLCIMGGEPLCEENLFLTNLVIAEIKKEFPDIKIYVWTGYYYEDLLKRNDPKVKSVLNNIYCLVDGPYIEAKRDITLAMRGSSNQSVRYLNNGVDNNAKG